MPKSPRRMKNQSHLRVDAEALLRQGIASSVNGWVLSADVLELLYKLASDPDRAADGLKLLHELQVHQVELDLQLHQIEVTENEIAEDLMHYQALFDFAPMGYLVLGYDGRVIESNAVGMALLGVERDELSGRFAESFWTPESRAAFSRFLKRLRDGGQREGCTVQSNNNRDGRQLQLTATMTPSAETILLVVTEIA